MAKLKNKHSASSGNPAIDYVNLVQQNMFQEDSYNVSVMCMLVKSNFLPCPDYNVASYTDFPNTEADYQAYMAPDHSMACLIVEAHNDTRAVAFADYKKESQFLIEINPDGYGDRITYQPLRDRKLLGIKEHFVPQP